jgi:nucleotide-binding universal stress UspA family protein
VFPPRTILVGTDFSACGAAALAAAVQLARGCDARIVLVNVVPAADNPYLALAGDDLFPELVDVEVRQAEQQLKLVGAEIEGVRLSTEVHEGPVVQTLLAVARANDADLVVVGTHGRKGFRRLMLGSIAEAVVRRSAVPVLTVRSSESVDDSPA